MLLLDRLPIVGVGQVEDITIKWNCEVCTRHRHREYLYEYGITFTFSNLNQTVGSNLLELDCNQVIWVLTLVISPEFLPMGLDYTNLYLHIYVMEIRHVNSIPTMHIFTGITRNTQSKS